MALLSVASGRFARGTVVVVPYILCDVVVYNW